MAVKYRRKRFPVLKFVKGMWGRLREHEIITYAAALSFYMLLSIIPLLFIGIAAVGGVVGGSNETTVQLMKWVKDILPFITRSMEESIYGLMEKRELFGGIGLFVLLWTAHMVLAETEKVVRRIFGVQKKRWLFFSYIIAWGIFLLSITFLTISFLISLSFNLIKGSLIPPAVLTIVGPLIDNFLIKYIPAVMVILAVTSAYKFLPQRHVPLSLAAAGGVSFTILWEIAKRLFIIYMGSVKYFNVIYGSLGVLMIFLLFIFYSAVIFIFIAEVLACILDTKEG